MYYATRKTELIQAISSMSEPNKRNLLETFMDEYGLYNLATATEEQLQAFLDAYRRREKCAAM